MKKSIFRLGLLVALCCFAVNVQATGNGQIIVKATEQITNETDGRPEKPLETVDEPPCFPGGNGALNKWLSSNIRYPESAQKQGVQGRVVVKFIVEKDGSVSNVEVVKSASPELDAEAVRVIKAMPNWTPGKNNGKLIRVYFTLPITFTLQDSGVSDYGPKKTYNQKKNEAEELERKGDAEVSKGNIRDALAFYKLAYDSFPFDLSPIEKSEVLLQDDKEALTDLYSSGMERLQRELAQSNDPGPYLELYYGNAIYLLEGLSALDPSDLDLKLLLQSYYVMTENFDKFIAMSEEIYPTLQKNTDFDDETKQRLLNGYACALVYLKDYKKVIKKIAPYKDFLMKSSNPELSGPSIYMLGLAYRETGKKKEAAKIKDWLLKNAPEAYQAFSEDLGEL